MHIEFCTKLNVLEGEYAIMQNIGFLLSWVGNPCRYLVLRPCKKGPDFVEALLALIDFKIEYKKIDIFYSDPLPDLRPDLEASGYTAFAY